MKLAWSTMAALEMQALRRYSVTHWGSAVAQGYLQDVARAAKQVCREPARAKLLRGRYRVLRVRSHYLIVHVDEAADRVTIARVLHASMDISRHLP